MAGCVKVLGPDVYMTDIEFFKHLQKLCLPGIWSQGMSLVRSNCVIKDSITQSERNFRVKEPNRAVGRKVSLWPEDEDWFCDCEAKTPVCSHIAAAAIFLNNPPALQEVSESVHSNWLKLKYGFRRINGSLAIDRWLESASGQRELLTDSLVGIIGGISSGRIKSFPITTIKEDFGIDAILNERRRGELNPAVLARLMKALVGFSNVYLDDKPITVSSQLALTRITIHDEAPGFRFKLQEDHAISEIFQNGAALCGDVLKPMEVPKLTPAEQNVFAGKGKYFGPADVRMLVLEFIPFLKKKIRIEIIGQNLPEIKLGQPKIVLELQQGRGEEKYTLSVLPTLVYAHEEKQKTRRKASDKDEDKKPVPIFQPDPAAEKLLFRKLQGELQLTFGQTVKFQGTEAVKFTSRLKNWQTSGNGMAAFGLQKELAVRLDVTDGDINVFFESAISSNSSSKSSQSVESSGTVESLTVGDVTFDHSPGNSKVVVKAADATQVFQAWRENQSFVPLLGGGWAPLPNDWLNRYGSRIISLLAAKNAKKGVVPAYLVPEITQLCEDTGNTYPDSLKKLKHLLTQIEEIPEAPLPGDLKVTLRHYQQIGLNWLCFLRDAHMGALLADDMGLGKTLQAICAIQGRTLIIAPTSVLPNWVEQISTFRPDLSYSVFYGSQRVLDPKSQIVITSYALLRLNKELLRQETWETVILDEAQTIKNPGSQTAKAAHSLKANFRLALSGTPVENHLSDLWSLFNFINPGLLSSLDDFHESFATAIAKGDREITNQLRTRIRPFILRRLKKEVAPELPPRTETVLYCELDQNERDLYESLLASTRDEVIEKLETKGNVFAALELLLRLRQACCHGALVPGELRNVDAKDPEKIQPSSKVKLLIETLKESIELGHRSLIFSQWTSYLDLIQKALDDNGITYVRLDGSTRNRAEVVEQFQTQPKYQTMLISLKAGGTGLNLTAADHVFLMDPWWNPAVEDQAADRAHRIGQENPVLIHRLVAQGTVEERILTLQKSKAQIAESVLQGSAASITRADLLNLLN
jgi:superfamily II DNA or RNA helicase